MKRLYKINWLLVLLIASFFIRLFRISDPPIYIFDEVYHVVSIKAIANNNPAGYEWWHDAPEPKTSYEWLHPPLAKLIQASSVKLLGENSFAWRLPSAIFGTLSILALYFLGTTLTKSKNIALLAAAIFSLDGLQLTMSQIAMNDIFVTTWIILALAFFFKKRFLLTAIFTGLSLSTKHSGALLYPIFSFFLLPEIIKKPKKIFKLFYFFVIIPLTIYLLSYTQFFLQGHTLEQFKELHQQIYWYQTNLTATHDYQSKAWQWPLLVRPVWFHVEYLKNKIANIYNLGNPAIFWGGLVAIGYTFLRNLTNSKKFLLVSYFLLFSPFVFSPRIMFFHHYLPALSLLCLIIAQSIYKNKKLTLYFLLLTTILFLFFFPLNTAIPLPKELLKYWFWLPTWK